MPTAISSMAKSRRSFNIGLGEVLFQVTFLDVLDRVPTDAEMLGHGLDGHVLRQFQRIALEGVRVAPPRFGKADGHLTRDVAVVAFHAGICRKTWVFLLPMGRLRNSACSPPWAVTCREPHAAQRRGVTFLTHA